MIGGRIVKDERETGAPWRPSLLVQRFPDHWGQILEVCAGNEQFLGLCRDYEDAVRAARRWQTERNEEARQRAREYVDLAGQLERELLLFLEEESSSQAAGERRFNTIMVSSDTHSEQDP